MARPRIVEVDYYELRAALASAADSGLRIEPAQKERWKAWVQEHGVREAAFRSFGDEMYEGLVPVIIASEDEWKGYYLMSTIDEACLKWAK